MVSRRQPLVTLTPPAALYSGHPACAARCRTQDCLIPPAAGPHTTSRGDFNEQHAGSERQPYILPKNRVLGLDFCVYSSSSHFSSHLTLLLFTTGLVSYRLEL